MKLDSRREAKQYEKSNNKRTQIIVTTLSPWFEGHVKKASKISAIQQTDAENKQTRHQIPSNLVVLFESTR
ncbi:MAG: hypothetical protein LBB39_03255 [Mycoplasmataceae bacterium]|nr:hypothetical protein [Mycoplasmataceae bacterium]